LQRTVPQAPEPPKPDRIYKDSVTISWRPPKSDGKSKIRGYIIEYKEKDSEAWLPSNTVEDLITGLTHNVPKLTEGKEYQFRVIAGKI
jgi:hypothetical protein